MNKQEFIKEAYNKIEELCHLYNSDEDDAVLNIVYMLVHDCGKDNFHFHTGKLAELIQQEKDSLEKYNKRVLT